MTETEKAEKPMGPARALEARFCSAIGCYRPIPMDRLCCFTHWRQLPYTLQRQVWATFRAKGAAVFTVEHARACAQAVERLAEIEGTDSRGNWWRQLADRLAKEKP